MKKIIKTQKAPDPVGAYSQAILVNNMLFTSGQIAIHPENGNLILDDIKKETNRVMLNLEAVLSEANMTFENVVKTSIFIADMNDFSAINEVYGSFFNNDTAPARETVQVACLPKNVHVEISMIAVLF